ncbi:unnamed protein product [Choristocarpus tenellus]
MLLDWKCLRFQCAWAVVAIVVLDILTLFESTQGAFIASPCTLSSYTAQRPTRNQLTSCDVRTASSKTKQEEDAPTKDVGQRRRRLRRALVLRAKRIVRARQRRRRRSQQSMTVGTSDTPFTVESAGTRVTPVVEDTVLPPSRGRPLVNGNGRGQWRSVFGPRPLLELQSVGELSYLVDKEGWGLEDLSVKTSRRSALDVDREEGSDGGERYSHPVVQAILSRAAAGSKPSGRTDGMRIGLAIEVRYRGIHVDAKRNKEEG